ncbi:MAG: MFS transporter [Thermoplasmata archaeon]
MDSRERTLVAYATVAHSLNHAYILLIPLFIRIWIEEFQSDVYVMGLVASAAYAFFGGGSLPFGYLADRIGSRGLLMVYLGGAAASLLLISVSQGLLQLTLALSLLGLSSSIYHPSAIAMISREVREQGRGLGYHGMGGSLGIALGPFIASLLLLSMGWRTALLLFSSPALLLLAVLAIRGPVELAPRRAPTLSEMSRSFANYGFLLVLLVYVFAGVAYWGALTFLPLYLDTLQLPSLSLGTRLMTPGAYLFSALLAVGAAGQVAGGHLADRSRVESTLAVSSVLVAILLILLALPPSLAIAVVAVAFGFLLFSLEPMQNVLVSTRTPGNVRGVAFGMVFLSVFGIGALGAALGGYVSETKGLSAIFPILSSFMVVSGASSLLLRRLAVRKAAQLTISSKREE